MRILVTGGSGFIGTNLVDELLPDHDVITYDSAAPLKPSHREIWRQGSILDAEKIARLYHAFQPEIVFHLAARTDLGGTELADYAANTQGVRNVIDAASNMVAKPHTIYASSRLVFDINYSPKHTFDYRPSTVYGRSKVESEKIIRRYGSEGGTWAIVRPTSIWGPWFGVPYRDFFDRVSRRHYVHINGVNPRKSYGYVGNSVYQLKKLAFAQTGLTNQNVYWLSDYPAISLVNWANMIADAFGVRRPISIPKASVRGLAVGGDSLKRLGWRNPPLTTFRFNNLCADMEYDLTQTESLVGPLPFSLQQAVHATVDWMKSDSGKIRS